MQHIDLCAEVGGRMHRSEFPWSTLSQQKCGLDRDAPPSPFLSTCRPSNHPPQLNPRILLFNVFFGKYEFSMIDGMEDLLHPLRRNHLPSWFQTTSNMGSLQSPFPFQFSSEKCFHTSQSKTKWFGPVRCSPKVLGFEARPSPPGSLQSSLILLDPCAETDVDIRFTLCHDDMEHCDTRIVYTDQLLRVRQEKWWFRGELG